jgi:hypothetical protein
MRDNTALVTELNKERMEAMVQRDIAKLDNLLCNNLVYTHSSSRLDSKSSLINDIQSGATICNSVVPSEVKAQDLGESVVLTGIVHMSAVRNGTQNEFTARFSDVYQNQNGTWRMVAQQSTKILT